GGLAGAGRPHHRDEVARLNRKADVGERHHGLAAEPVVAREVRRLNEGGHRWPLSKSEAPAAPRRCACSLRTRAAAGDDLAAGLECTRQDFAHATVADAHAHVDRLRLAVLAEHIDTTP